MKVLAGVINVLFLTCFSGSYDRISIFVCFVNKGEVEIGALTLTRYFVKRFLTYWAVHYWKDTIKTFKRTSKSFEKRSNSFDFIEIHKLNEPRSQLYEDNR